MISSENELHPFSQKPVRFILTPSPVAQSTYLYVQEISYSDIEASSSIKHARIASYLFLYTLSGTGHLYYQGQSYSLQAGDFFWIDCKEEYRYEADVKQQWETLSIHMYGATIEGYYRQYEANQLPIYHAQPSSILLELALQILNLQYTRTQKTELLNAQLLTQLLTEIIMTTIYARDNTYTIPSKILNMQTYLEHNYTQAITLDQLARQYGMNKFQLTKDFKQYIGLPPIEYLIHIRINAAKGLLQYSDKSVQEIANEVGVDNVSHFINLFKARVNSTPLSYRKEWS